MCPAAGGQRLRKERRVGPVLYFIVFTLLIRTTLGALDQQEQKEIENDNPIGWLDLIPGLRQLEKNRRITGYALLSGFCAGIGGAVLFHLRGRDRYRAYLDSTRIDEVIRFRDQTEKAFLGRNLFLAGTLAVWVVHVLDLTIQAKRSRIKGEFTENCLRITFSYSF